MHTLKNKIKDLSLMITIAISNIFYVLLNNGNRGSRELVTYIDKITPFIKEFVIPYILWYIYIPLGLFIIYIFNKKNYFNTIITLNISLIISYLIFYFFQTTVPRPILYGDDIFTKLVMLIYNHDNPYNCFPSVHVISTYMVMRGINSSISKKVINYSIQITGILIILSTIFIKQHVVLDIISAILINETVIFIFNFIKENYLLKKYTQQI